ncbi:MAG TPA: NAD(P)-dependent oxidoreductase [Gemmatimonadaceae bacterium]|jgi:nucleoside-diphosphate-sugar epimerase|nr:NAD(P)-dependent oxidoreductase [Gemmatimonadaceae bacterium]
MSRILLTGATGVVGRLALPLLLERGHTVTAVGRSPASRASLAELGAAPIELDLLDIGAARRAMSSHDVVINLATHMPASAFRMLLPWEWRENDCIRRLGSATLVDAALASGVRRFIQESYAPVYDDGAERWIDESWPQRPAPYNRSVLDAERSAERFTTSGGTGVVLRFAGFYGPDPFLREMLRAVRRGWSPLSGAAHAYWSSVAHHDAATAVVAALDVPAGAYNVCDDEPLTRREWADALADAAGLTRPRLMPAWLGAFGGKTMELLSRSERMSNRKLKRVTGWTPRWPSARDGLRAAVEELSPARSRHSSGQTPPRSRGSARGSTTPTL